MAVRPKEDRRGKADYSKKHACLFCGRLDPKIARHLCSKEHKEEKVIAQLPPPKKRGSVSQLERERALDALRNEGDFLYNVDILKNGDKNGFGLITAKRPEASQHNPKDYLPCKYCLRFYVKTELWRHGQRCQFMPKPLIEDANVLDSSEEEKESRKFIKKCTLLLNGAGVPSRQITQEDKEDFHYYVLSSLQEDVIGKSLKQDRGIVNYGRNEFERLGRRRANEVRYRMRLLERIKQEVVSLDKSDKDKREDKKSDLASVLVPEKFDLFVQAVRILSGISDERSLNGVIMFEKPQLAKKTGQILKKFGEMSEGEAVVERNKDKREDIADFLFLYGKNWSGKIGSLAHQTTIEKRFNKKEMLPVTEDLQKLQKYLDNEIGIESQLLASEPSKHNWKDLAFLLLTKITLFNFRRGNECAAMQVKKFQQRDDWRSGNQEIYQSLTSFEQELAKR